MSYKTKPFLKGLDRVNSDDHYDLRLLKLNCSNDPLTGDLELSKVIPELRLTDTASDYMRIVRDTTLNRLTIYNRAFRTAGYALDFTGAAGGGSNVIIPDDDTLDPVGDGVSISFWAYWDGSGSTISFICAKSIGGLEIHTGGGGGSQGLRWIPTSTGSATYLDTGANKFPSGQWNHIVCTYNNILKVGKVYVNGVDTSASQTGNGNLAASATNFYLGRRSDGTYPFDGKIDEFAMWGKVLSQSDVTALYDGGAGLYINPSDGTWGTNLLCLYHFDEGVGTVVGDSSENDNNGVTAGTTWVEGKINSPGTMEEMKVLQAENGERPNEWGISTLGETLGKTILTGKRIQFSPNSGTEFTPTAGNKTYIDQLGRVGINIDPESETGTAQLSVVSTNPKRKMLLLRACAGQTANLFEIQNSAKATSAFANSEGVAVFNRYQSTVATGSIPYLAQSTTMCTNLNADLLDGQHGSYYSPTTHNHDTAYLQLSCGNSPLTGDLQIGTNGANHNLVVKGTITGISTIAATSTVTGSGFIAGTSTGVAGTVTVITALQNNTSPAKHLEYKSRDLTYTGGIITTIGTESGWTDVPTV